MRMKSWSIVSLLIILPLVLSACAPAAANEGRAPLRVSWAYYEADYTMIIAKEKGFFDKYNVPVEPVYYDDYYQTFSDLAEHKIDGGLFIVGDMLRLDTLTSLKGVVIYDSGGSSKIVSTQEISGVADLRGKNIGLPIGANEEIMVREMLYGAGLTLKDVQFVDTSVEDVPNRLGETIDAGYVFSPFDQEALDNGHKILYTPDLASSIFADVILFREDVIQERPEDIRAFVNAWFDALQYRLENMDECNQIIAEKTGQNVEDVSTISVILYNREDNLRLFQSDGEAQSIYKIAEVHADFLNLKGQLTTPIDVKQIFDPSFLEQ